MLKNVDVAHLSREGSAMSGFVRFFKRPDAVRNATPESRAAFEERFGPIAFTEYIIGSPSSGGWVEAKTLTEDGHVERVLYDGDSEKPLESATEE